MGKKIVCFSIDDGNLEDRFIVEQFDKYGIKGTFNICSGRLGRESSFTLYDTLLNTSSVTAKELSTLYKNHEIASHTKNHKNMLLCTDQEIVDTGEGDRIALEKASGKKVIGLAYPEGAPNHDDHVTNIIKEKTNFLYARSYQYTNSFDMPTDFYEWKMTSGVSNPKLLELIDQFQNEQTDEDRLMLLFTHGFNLQVDGKKYGLNTSDCFEWFKKVCAYLADKGFTFMTMADVYYYMQNK